MRRLRELAAAAAVVSCLAGVAPAMAGPPPDRGSTPGLGWGAGGSRGAPVPVAGVGLPLLLGAVGAYLVAQRRRKTGSSRED